MAEALIQVALENLNSLIQRELGLLWGIEKEMGKLSSLLSTIQAVLEDAEEKQLKDKVLSNWLLKLNSAAYEVDDILDDCATEASKLQNKHRTFIKHLVCNSVGNILFRHKTGKRMKAVIEKLDAIAEERIKFHLREIGDRMPLKVNETRETGSILTQSSIFGRDQDKERIIEMLVEVDGTSVCENVSVLPIVGMGGLGKTTLAQMVFNDKRVFEHFNLRLWVCVTTDFDAKRLMKEILESATRSDSDALLSLDPLQRSLQDLLNKKRFLLVLDDVWNEDQDKWDSLKDVLAHGSRGSSIIITTRLKKVAMIVGTLPAYCLSNLSDEDCWLLFKQRAFAQEMKEVKLEEISREIVAKCGGVPLAAKALGGLLRFKKEEKEWLFVKESDIWNLPQGENGILPALRLSYHNLTPELRRCFAYCSVFGKSTEIDKEKLIHLWMANGFISSRGSLEMEDVGNEVWNELYLRSFFQDVRKNGFGEVVAFKMHDLIHDLAQSVMEGSRISQQMFLRDQHLLLPLLSKTQMLKNPSKFGCLRVLDASKQWELTKVSSAIGSLKHLRYLNLSSTGIQMLPDMICDLWNLQILNLDFCRMLERLPKDICRLKNLRHLCLLGCPLIEMPPSIGQLTCLRTLNKFIVGKQRGFKISELQHLNLGGTLHITNLENVKSSKDAEEANLEGKQDLQRLELSWDSQGDKSNEQNPLHNDIIKYLAPHSQLHELSIYGFRGTLFPFWMSSPIMKGVVKISLANCKNCVNLPPIGEVPLLKYLFLEALPIEYVDNEFQGEGLIKTRSFPSLITLKMDDLPKLRKLSRQEGQELFPRLHNLYISNCPLFAFPSSPPSIKILIMCNFTNMVISTASNLRGLAQLYISDNKELISLPENLLQYNLNHLFLLSISCLEKLQTLPASLSSLTHLRYMHINDCPRLMSLPQSIQRMENLETLLVTRCPELHRRYNKGNGEHWHDIAHIPEVCITP